MKQETKICLSICYSISLLPFSITGTPLKVLYTTEASQTFPVLALILSTFNPYPTVFFIYSSTQLNHISGGLPLRLHLSILILILIIILSILS